MCVTYLCTLIGSAFGPIGAIIGAVSGEYLIPLAFKIPPEDLVEIIDFRAEENVQTVSTAPIIDVFVAEPCKEPNLFRIDVVGEEGTDFEWKRLGYSLVKHLKAHGKSATLIATYELDYYMAENTDDPATPFTSFDHEERTYFITKIRPSDMENYLPDICQCSEFILGANCWLSFSKNSDDSEDDVRLEKQMRNFISNMRRMNELKLTIELLAAVTDGFEVFWFNP